MFIYHYCSKGCKCMKKFFLLIINIIFIISLTSCGSYESVDFSNKIIEPENNNIPIRGTWKVSEIKNPLKKNDTEDYSNLKVQFSDEFVMIDNEVIINPKYKIKFIDVNKYMVDQYRVNIKTLDIEDIEKGEAIQINSDNGGLFEFIRTKEDEVILNLNGVFLFFKKESDKVDEKIEKVYMSVEEHTETINSKVLEAGILLGLKCKDSNGNLSYRTLWIAKDKDKYHEVYSSNDIIVPRRNGFWKLSIEYIGDSSVRKDKIEAYNILSEEKKTSYVNRVDDYRESIDINFIGNDYICFETIKMKEDGRHLRPNIKVVPIDNLSIKSGVKISDLAGKDGEEIFNKSAEGFFESNPNIKKENVFIDQAFFQLKRKSGRWRMVQRIVDKEMSYDIPLNMIPPKKLLNYDDLYISWNTIKSKEPGAEDAFSAPNNKFLIVQTKDSILIYDVENNKMGERPSLTIPLKEGEKAIMAEWGTGIYMQKWENVFKNYALPLK